MKQLQNYPSLAFMSSIVTDGRIILVDEPLSPDKRLELQKLETIDGEELLFLEDSRLAIILEEILKGIVENKSNTLLVFPGNGSNYPRQLSRVCQEFPNTTGVYAKRSWVPGTDPVVMAGIICPNIFIITRVKTVVVVDDVISSGLTMQKLHRNNAWRFPAAKWVGIAWMAQVPQMKAKSGIKGYEYVATACVVSKTSRGKVPINSISTLRNDLEIAESYAQRHFKDPCVFLHLIKA